MKIFLAFLFSFSVTSEGQEITVKEKTALYPLEHVSIYAEDLNASAVTGIDGKADLKEFEGSVKIIFRLIGYETIELSFAEVKEKDFIVLMEETPVTLEQVYI
jgi:hemoglobin/transferrin/lactoferrin receptor protein